NLLENLELNHIDVNDTPIVVQYNKRDIPGVLPVEQLQEALGFEGYPYTEASAIKGEGVMETFKLVSKITAKHLMARLKGGKSEAPTAAPPAAKKEAKPEAKAAKPVPKAPEPIAAEAPNPFAESVPFPESAPLDAGYEKMEEVSLEQLLSEGRERPSTMSGNVAVPIEVDDIEELAAEEMVPVAVMDEEPAIVSASHEDGRV